MNRYIDEIIKLIKEEPESWKAIDSFHMCSQGLISKNHGVEIKDYIRNTFFPRNEVCVDGKVILKGMSDSRAIERAVKWWYDSRTIQELRD